MDTPAPATQEEQLEYSQWKSTMLATFLSVVICVCMSIGGGISALLCVKWASSRKDRFLHNGIALERSTDESANLDDGDIEHGAGPSLLNVARANTTRERNARVRAEVCNDGQVRAASVELRATQNETKLEEDTGVQEERFAPPSSPPIHRTWMQSCGDVEPGARTRSTDGALLLMHSVGRLALYAGHGGNSQILHLPPEEASEAVYQMWRDRHGHVEVKVASQDGNHMEQIRLLDDVYTTEVTCRDNTGKCLIKPVIQGPSGVAFSPGSASISFFLGRYATLVLNKGDKGGPEGMDNFVRRTYFPVVEVVEGNSRRWAAEYNYEVVWKGDEVWLETDLEGFSRRGLAEIWDRFRTGLRQTNCRGSSAAKAVRASGADSSSGTVSSASTPPHLVSRLSLEPLGSERFPAGSIEVINATAESLQVMLVPEAFQTDETRARSREANVSVQVAGQGFSAGGSGGTSGSTSQQPTSAFPVFTWSTIPAGKSDYLQLPGGAQCRILWCSVSQPFYPEDLPIGDENDANRVTDDVLKSHGYDVAGVGWFSKNAVLHFKERSSREQHRSLLFVRVWSQTSIRTATKSTMRPEVLNDSCFWDAPVPSKQHIIPKISHGLAIRLPASERGPAWQV